MTASHHPALHKNAVLVRERTLPIPGDLLVETGDRVSAETIVATAAVQGAFQSANAAAALGVTPARVSEALRYKTGEAVEAGALIGETRALFGLLRNRLFAPCSGVIEDVSPVTGQVVIAEPQTHLSLPAYLSGEVIEATGCTTVKIRSNSSIIQGVFGVGGEAFGPLRIVDSAGIVSDEDAGRILVFAQPITEIQLRAMAAHRVSGAVSGAMSGERLSKLVGAPINPAATGDEPIPFALMLTEGFGDQPMAEPAFALLKCLDGAPVSMSGRTQVRAGVIRPEVVGPPLGRPEESAPTEPGDLEVGAQVRIIRGSAFGALGRIESAPDHHVVVPSGAKTLVFEVRLRSGDIATVPRANVEAVALSE